MKALKNKEDKKNKNINTINLLLFFRALKYAVLDKIINVLFKTTIELFYTTTKKQETEKIKKTVKKLSST